MLSPQIVDLNFINTPLFEMTTPSRDRVNSTPDNASETKEETHTETSVRPRSSSTVAATIASGMQAREFHSHPPSNTSLIDRAQEIKEPEPVDLVIGRIMFCRQCDFNKAYISKPSEMWCSTKGFSLTDPHGGVHKVSTDGVYNILDVGQNHYRIVYVREHDHIS